VRPIAVETGATCPQPGCLPEGCGGPLGRREAQCGRLRVRRHALQLL